MLAIFGLASQVQTIKLVLMIITCPKCSANFLVADALIPAHGRTVRCGACKHQWHAHKQEDAATTSNQGDLAAGFAAMDEAHATRRFQLPAIVKKPLPSLPFLIAMPVIALCWFITAIYTNYPSWLTVPGFSAIYSAMGATPTEGLRFSKASMAREEEGQRTHFVISGVIANESTKSRLVPSVRVQLLDDKGEEIASRIYVVGKTLQSGETYPFRITNLSTSFGHRVEDVVLDLGHDLQLLFR